MADSVPSAEMLCGAPVVTAEEMRDEGRPVIWVNLVILLLLFPIYNSLTPSPVVNYDNPSLQDITQAAEHGDNLNRTVIPLLAMVGMLLLLKHRHRVSVNLKIAVPLVAFLVWNGVTVLWSLDPSLSFVRFVSLTCMFMFAMGFAASRDTRSIVRFLVFFELVGAVSGACFEIQAGRFHPFASGYRFMGLAPHPNVQGAFLAIALVLVLWLWLQKDRSRWLTLAASLLAFLLMITGSRTSIFAALAACGALLVWVLLRRKPRLGPPLLACVILLGSVSCLIYLADTDGQIKSAFEGAVHRADDEGDPSQLSGRIALWHQLLQYAGQRPFTGFGFGSFWTPAHIEDVSSTQSWVIQQAHSGYLDLLLNTGMPGLLLYIVLLILLARAGGNRFSAGSEEGRGLWLAVAVFFLVHDVAEGIDVSSSFTNLVFYIALCKCALPQTVTQGAGAQPMVTRPGGRLAEQSQ